MIPAIRAEFRKLFSVRSTYVIFAAALGLEGIFALYAQGYKLTATTGLRNAQLLANQSNDAISAVSVFIGLIGVLLVTHEYRYNTILYTLTAASSRTKVYAAKFFAVSVVALVATAVLAILAPILTIIGVHVAGNSLVPQTIHVGDVIWRCLFGGWALSILMLFTALIIRSQVGAIAAVFLIPSTVEQLLTLLLKDKGSYLPFTSITAVLQKGSMSYQTAALTGTIYLVIFGAIAYVLFLKRDAN